MTSTIWAIEKIEQNISKARLKLWELEKTSANTPFVDVIDDILEILKDIVEELPQDRGTNSD